MNLESFEVLLEDENSVKEYLVRACWEKDLRFCIRCKTTKIYRIRRDRYRCSRCGYEFSDFAGRWINKVKLPHREWLRLIRLFELEISARGASLQLGISYPTVHKAFHLIRRSIAAHCGNGDSLMDGTVETKGSVLQNLGERSGMGNRQYRFPVFGILERKGLVKVEALQDLSAEAVLNLAVKTVRTGSIVYTERWGRYDALIFCGHKRITDGERGFSRGDVHIDGSEGFWSYTIERMNKFHGVSTGKFPLYLKEMEFRYNHRHQSIFNILVQYLCDLRET